MWSSVVTLAFAVLVTVLAVGWSQGRLNSVICGGDCGAENATAPDGLRDAGAAVVAADPAPEGQADLDAMLDATKPARSSAVLGDHVGLAIGAPQIGGPVVTAGEGGYVPASTTKLLTTFAALARLEPGQRFATSVVAEGDRLVLVGGGDPYLTGRRAKGDPPVVRAELSTLAEKAARSLKASGTTTVTLGFDDALFAGPAVNPAWPATYVRDNVVTPIGALWVDRGMLDTSHPETTARRSDPPQHAADLFAGYLRREGIQVRGEIARTASPRGATAVASVESATLAQIVESTIRTSDDEAAEVLLRHVAIAAGEPPTFEGGTRAVVATLSAAHLDIDGLKLEDGSGLSRDNRISPTTLVAVLRAALAEGRFAPVLDDLPVSGFSGTLAARFAHQAHGLVRAKTGTLTGVHSLAGVALDGQGRPVVFAVMADRTDRAQPFAAQAALDKIAAALTSP